MKCILVPLSLILIVACGRGGATADPEFAAAAPADFNALALEISGDAAEASQALLGDSLEQKLDGAPESLAAARAQIAALNTQVKAMVANLKALAAELGEMENGTTAVYGPTDKNGVTWKLTVQKGLTRTARPDAGVRAPAGELYGWKLEGKPVGADDAAYVKVAAGALAASATAHRGAGGLGIDLDALGGLDASVKARGQLLVGYANGGDSKSLSFALRNFTADPATAAPASGVFVGHKLASKTTSVRAFGKLNLADSPTTAPELVRVRVRFNPLIGGRADLLATGGDVPAGKLYLGSACFDTSDRATYSILRLCDKAQPAACTTVSSMGSSSACPAGYEVPMPPPENVDDSASEPASPDAVTPPSDMPTGEP